MKLSISLPDELVARLDAAKGDWVPRSAWIAWAVEQALVDDERGAASPATPSRAAPLPAPAEPAASEANGARSGTQADPAPVPSSEGVRSAPPVLSRAEAFRRATRNDDDAYDEHIEAIAAEQRERSDDAALMSEEATTEAAF